MAENLAYLPAVSIPYLESDTDPYYYVYGYAGSSISAAKATTNYTTYGVLYNGEAAKIACPSGWHLPSDAEWTSLTDYLTNNGYGYEGSGNDIAKSMASTSGWPTFSTAGTIGNDQGSNNRSGFTALPGGYRKYNSFGVFFSSHGGDAHFWSSSKGGLIAWYRALGYSENYVYRGNFYRTLGLSVRCLQN